MPETPNQNRIFRFGLYELDAATGELRKDGKNRPRLQGQPLEVLLHLLDHPGEWSRGKNCGCGFGPQTLSSITTIA